MFGGENIGGLSIYTEEIKQLNNRVSGFMHAYTLYSAPRPFGCSVMLGSYDAVEGPLLFMVDPSGMSWGYKGVAIGKAKQAAKTELEKLKIDELTCEEAIKEAAKIIYVVHDEVKDKQFELELSWVGEVTDGKHKVVPQEIFQEAEQYAKDAIAESDSEDEAQDTAT